MKYSQTRRAAKKFSVSRSEFRSALRPELRKIEKRFLKLEKDLNRLLAKKRG